MILLQGRYDYHPILQMGTMRLRKQKTPASPLGVGLPGGWVLSSSLFLPDYSRWPHLVPMLTSRQAGHSQSCISRPHLSPGRLVSPTAYSPPLPGCRPQSEAELQGPSPPHAPLPPICFSSQSPPSGDTAPHPPSGVILDVFSFSALGTHSLTKIHLSALLHLSCHPGPHRN